MPSSPQLDLWARVSDLYGYVRRRGSGETAWAAWCKARDELFRDHPQSPLDEATRRGFAELRYFPYDPSLRFEVDVQAFSEPDRTSIGNSGSCATAFRRFGRAGIEVAGTITSLTFCWVEGYGGGVFVPFGDVTNRRGGSGERT